MAVCYEEREMGILFFADNNDVKLIAYTDSDWASDPETKGNAC